MATARRTWKSTLPRSTQESPVSTARKRWAPSSPSTFGRRYEEQSIHGGSWPATCPTARYARLASWWLCFRGNGETMGRRHLVGIEEPESALHPAAAGVLIDSLTDASQLAQVVVTSHSADLLDNDAIPDNAILAVACRNTLRSKIGHAGRSAGRSALRDQRLFTAGELLTDGSVASQTRSDSASRRA